MTNGISNEEVVRSGMEESEKIVLGSSSWVTAFHGETMVVKMRAFRIKGEKSIGM